MKGFTFLNTEAVSVFTGLREERLFAHEYFRTYATIAYWLTLQPL